MIIKIDKQKVVEAAEKQIDKLDKYNIQDRDKILNLCEMKRMCNLAEDQTVIITDEDVALLGL